MIIGAVAAVALVAVVGPLAARALAAAPDVQTAKVARETLSVTVTLSGKTQPAGAKDVFPPTQGTIKQVVVTAGQQVRAGQVLATMDTKPLDAQVLSAKAAYEAAEAQVDGIDSQAPSATDYQAAREGLRAAKAGYDQASDNVASLKAAGAKVPAAQLKAAQTQRDSAHAGYLQAKSAKRKLDNASVGSQRSAAIAQRAQAKAALDTAEANLDKASLKAPIDGIVVFNALGASAPGAEAPKATDGCAVSPAAAPFTVVPVGSARFSGNADEVDVARIKTGDTAVVKLDAFPGEEFKTKVGSIEPQSVQTKTGGTAFPVLLPLLDTGKTIRIGMSGTADIAVDAVKEVSL
jgi:HlyD family secretion protein